MVTGWVRGRCAACRGEARAPRLEDGRVDDAGYEHLAQPCWTASRGRGDRGALFIPYTRPGSARPWAPEGAGCEASNGTDDPCSLPPTHAAWTVESYCDSSGECSGHRFCAVHADQLDAAGLLTEVHPLPPAA